MIVIVFVVPERYCGLYNHHGKVDTDGHHDMVSTDVSKGQTQRNRSSNAQHRD